MEEKVKELLKKLDMKIEEAQKEYRHLTYQCASDTFWYKFCDREGGYLSGLKEARELVEKYLK